MRPPSGPRSRTTSRSWASEVSEEPRFPRAPPDSTLVLYDPDAHVISAGFKAMAEVAYPERVGPLVVENAGHFLQWEEAEVLNQAVRYFCLDLLAEARGR